MVDTKISALTAIAAIAGEDLLAAVDDPSGAPATTKATITQLATFLSSLSETLTNKTIDGDLNTIIDINETQQNVSTGVSGTLLTSNGVGAAPSYQAAAGGGLTFARVVKKVDETINNSTTLQDDDELFVALSINKTYFGILYGFALGATTPDIKTNFTIPTGATGLKSTGGFGTSTSAFADDITTAATIALFATNRFFAMPFKVDMGSTAGNITLQWAQNSLEVSDLTVLTGSTIIIWEEV